MFFKHRQELYFFRYGERIETYTTSNKEFSFQNNVYKPDAYLSRTKITNQGANDKSPEVSITMTKDSKVASWFKVSSPYRKVELFIYQVNIDDPDDYLILWSGTVIAATFKNNSAKLECFSKDQMLDKTITRMTHQYSCNLNLYFGSCGININNHSYNTTITNIAADGITLTLAGNQGRPDEWFTNGTLKRNSDDQERMITSQKGNVVKLLYVVEDLKGGDSVRFTWGCDRLPTTCKHKFNNLKRFRGEPFIPEDSPFITGIKS